MKNILKIMAVLTLCFGLFSISVNAEEVQGIENNKDTIVESEISPRYGQTINYSTNFLYEGITYRLNSSWSVSVDNNTGKLVGASLLSTSSNLPDPLYQSATISSTNRVNNYQIKYTLKITVKAYGLTYGTATTTVTVNSPGPI